MKVNLLKKELVVGTLVCMLVFTTFAGAISSTNTSTKSNDNEPANRAYPHTVLGEYFTMTTCVPCKYAHSALKDLYAHNYHSFYYITYVYNKGNVSKQRKTELNVIASPTVCWDGDYKRDVGGSSNETEKTRYNTSIIACGNRNVKDIDLSLDVEWLGAVNPCPEDGAINVSVQTDMSWTISEMEINVSITNNEASQYNGHLHVYVTEVNSTWYNDKFGNPYTFEFKNYAYNQDVTLSAGATWDPDPIGWDGLDYTNGTHNFGHITQDNIMVIASVFNQSTNYSDETTGFRAGVGTDPKTFDIYFGNSTPPPKIMENVTLTSFVLEEGYLEFNTTYYWKVDVWDALGNIIEGEIWSFTTRDNNPPYTPSDPIPPDGATNVSGGGICWTGGDPDDDYVTYDVYFGNTTPPPLVAEDINVTCCGFPGSVKFNTTYYWKIVARDEYHLYKPHWIYNTSGPIWSFTTEANLPPYEPSNPHPPDGGANVPVNVTFCWEGGDPNPGDIVTYDVYLGVNCPPHNLVSYHQTETCYEATGLELYERYYWLIVAWDSQDLSTTGPIWHFTTGVNHPPDAPHIDGPTVKPVPRPLPKPGEPINYTFKSTDPDGDNVSYYIEWGDGTYENWFGPFQSGEEVIRNHTWIELGTYAIRAKAKDIWGAESDWGTLDVIMPKNQQVGNMWFLRWLERFPILQKILDVLRLNN
ncbi:hypothetical protein MBGDF03_00311 [Thermoplasmatales archaeon SCGC AB-540-F20]|nr:hypothetical protein MBGDF03_00311 [Thermoplasmatales archaeon SCGC AB-540-F20]